MASARTATEVTAARYISQDGNFVGKLFTGTTTGTEDTWDLSAYFESIYYVRAWDTGDGTDAEAFETAGTYAPAITTTQNKGAIYIIVEGKQIKSVGGAT